MAKPKILLEGQSYTFRSYFEFPYEPEQIIAEFGYKLMVQRLTLPQWPQASPRLAALQEQIEETLPLVSLSSETARRELLVAPLLIEVARLAKCQLRIEYPLKVNAWLKGELDYLLRSKHSLTVIEAKRDDLTRGFTQLAVELIALAEVEEQDTLYGAVTIGEMWRFGKLERGSKIVFQDVSLYNLLDNIERLISILMGILSE